MSSSPAARFSSNALLAYVASYSDKSTSSRLPGSRAACATLSFRISQVRCRTR